MKINLNRVKSLYEEMSSVGATPEGGVSRFTLSQADKEARDLFVNWLNSAGLDVRIDDIGNIYGRREGTDPKAKPIVLGSHLDSIINGGTFDGVLGLISALEVIRTLQDNSIITKRPIEVVNFTNEEGVRFEPLMAGSGVLSGDYHLDDVYMAEDEAGKNFLEELRLIGYLGKREHRLQEAEAFIELHIEQGPILDTENIPIGVVEGILGFNWLEVTVIGEENNSGPTPMYSRKDPLSSSAKMILAIQELAKEIGERAITTVGKVTTDPGSINTIPGKVTFLVDVRGENSEQNKFGMNSVIEKVETIAKQDGVQAEIKVLRVMEPTVFSPKIVETITDAANMLGYPVKRMVSGAGHIATFMNNFCPTAMIFVPSVGGKSHSPEELTRWEDIEKGTNTLLYAVLKLAQH